MIHTEFYCEYKNGSRDWVDPVLSYEHTEETIIVFNGSFHYSFDKEDLSGWVFRPYTEETTYNRLDED